MTRLATIVGIAAALFFFSMVVWRAGFDSGAVAMQCLDFHAILGAEEAMESDACKEAARRQQSDILFLMFGKS